MPDKWYLRAAIPQPDMEEPDRPGSSICVDKFLMKSTGDKKFRV